MDEDFSTLPDRVRRHAQDAPERAALIEGERQLDYAALDRLMDQVASALQRDGIAPGDVVAICATMSLEYAAVFLGALRAGVVVAPLAPGAGAASLQTMLQDAAARLVFVDRHGDEALGPQADGTGLPRIHLDRVLDDGSLDEWMNGSTGAPLPIEIGPQWPFNIIYSSGTTGAAKGIVQSHGMRWTHVRRGAAYGYGPGTVTLLATPLYSNTTLVVFCPTLACGATTVLMPKFDAGEYLALAQQHRATHTMLVPVQYRRLMAHPQFGAHDLSAFRMKFCTSAPFDAALKADVLARWPGGLVEFYGMTEGGGTCILDAHLHPDKLHTVGRPAAGHDMRLIDDAGVEVTEAGGVGEVVGHSAGMMTGYHGQPEKTREAEWFDPHGKRFIRTGDIGRFDEDGFLVLIDRKKDMLISGGFNIYPSDLEAVLRAHPQVADAAVVGVPSERWGETPVAFVVLHHDANVPVEDLLAWANTRLGKTQRLSELRYVDDLPRSAIGKVLKRELRESYTRTDNKDTR